MIVNKEYNEKNLEYLKNALKGKEYRVLDEDGVEIAARTSDIAQLDEVLDILPFQAKGFEVRSYAGKTKAKKGADTRFFFFMEGGKKDTAGLGGFGSLERERAQENTAKDIELMRMQFKLEALTKENKALEKDCKEMAAELAANDSKGGSLGGIDLGQLFNVAGPMILSKYMGVPQPTLAGPAKEHVCERCAALAEKAGDAYSNVCEAAEMLAEDPELMKRFESVI